MKESYESECRLVDFKSAHENARLEINGWVNEKTRGTIADLLAPKSLDEDSRLVLINTVYFKGSLHSFTLIV